MELVTARASRPRSLNAAITGSLPIFSVEREINGLLPAERQAARDVLASPRGDAAHLVAAKPGQALRQGAKAPVAKAIDYMLKRWPAFTRFLDDGRVCLSNNAAERAIRPIAVGRRNWTFAGSDNGGRRAARKPARLGIAVLSASRRS